MRFNPGRKRAGRRHVYVRGQMNSDELEFYQMFIWPLEKIGEVVRCEFEKHKLILAKQCTYTPDFMLAMSDGSQRIIEVKGGLIYEGAREKYLWAAEKYGSEYAFEAWQKKRGLWKQIWK